MFAVASACQYRKLVTHLYGPDSCVRILVLLNVALNAAHVLAMWLTISSLYVLAGLTLIEGVLQMIKL